jgi:hypothetical protein
MRKHAFVTRAFSQEVTAKIERGRGDIILNMPEGQFNDWRGVELVREATAAEVKREEARLAGTKPKNAAPRAAKAKAKPKPKPKPAKPAAAPTVPADPAPPAALAPTDSETDEAPVS